jgi:hypothetical protein
MYYTLLGDLKSYEPFPSAKGDCRFSLDSGRWFVNVPVTATAEKTESQGRVVVIDPGIRTFATFLLLSFVHFRFQNFLKFKGSGVRKYCCRPGLQRRSRNISPWALRDSALALFCMKDGYYNAQHTYCQVLISIGRLKESVTTAAMERESIMTNQQFDAILKMVLDLLDAYKNEPGVARKKIARLLIDEKAREEFEKNAE